MTTSLRNAALRFGRATALAALIGGMTAVSIVPAHAYSKRVQKACLADYKSLCPQYRTESSQLRACMEAKSSQISWGCIEALMDSGEVDRKRVTRR
jgi:hypothetical protein